MTSQTTTTAPLWNRLYDYLTAPHSSHKEIDTLRARALSTFMLAGFLTTLLSIPVVPRQAVQSGQIQVLSNPGFIGVLIALPTSLALYALSRTRYLTLTSILVTVMTWVAITSSLLRTPVEASLLPLLAFLVMPVVIAAMFLSQWAAIVVTLANLGLILFFRNTHPMAPSDQQSAILYQLGVPVLVIAFNWYIRAVERLGRRQLQDVNQDLNRALELTRQARQRAESAQNQVETATRVKSEFIATMSHELRTPLAAINGFSDMILQGFVGPIDSTIETYIQRISLNGQRLLNLIGDVLDLSKIEAHRVQVIQEPISIRDLAKALWEQHHPLGQERGLSFSYHVDAALPDYLSLDPEITTRIINTLISNAIKFTHAGTITLDVEPTSQPDHWQIAITDTGIGIPQDALDYIFEAFRQVDGSSTRKYGGTGLGLTIAKRYTALMNGTITVRSEEGKGSVFTIVLPLIHPPESALTTVLPEPLLIIPSPLA